jgi:hypothetical protein
MGERIKVSDQHLLPCPPDLADDRLLIILDYWPAWRVTEWGGLEVGSGVLVIGEDGVAWQVAQLCRLRGVLWRALWGGAKPGQEGEYWLPLRDGQTVDELLRHLPVRPDTVIMLTGGAHELCVATEVCRDGATVVLAGPVTGKADLSLYPDVHRRGIYIRAGSPFQYDEGDIQGWRQAAQRINTLIDLRRLETTTS